MLLQAYFSYTNGANSGRLNTDKTNLVRSTIITTPTKSYSINNNIIAKISVIQVHFSPDLTWSDYIDYITNNAFNKLRPIKRRLSGANAKMKMYAHAKLIRSALQYALIIWHLTCGVLKSRLDSV